MRSTPFLRTVATIVGLLAATAGLGQGYPNKAIRAIVATSPGGNADLRARVYTPEFSKAINQTVVVDNKAGANQIIALDFVAKAPADGYVIGIIGTDAMTLLPFVAKSVPFDPLKDLTVVAGLAEARYVLAGAANKPFNKSFNDFIAYARANPGVLNYGVLNYGESGPQVHFPLLVLAEHFKLNWVRIPYAGAGQYLPALAAGTVDIGIASEGSASGLGERVRVLAITGDTRAVKWPDAPTFGELGFPTVRGPSYAVVVRSGMPREIIDKIAAATATAVNSAEVHTGFGRLLLTVTPDKQDAATKKFAGQLAFYGDFAKKIGLKPE